MLTKAGAGMAEDPAGCGLAPAGRKAVEMFTGSRFDLRIYIAAIYIAIYIYDIRFEYRCPVKYVTISIFHP
ncbi:hypothetical protein [Massilia sp. YIM B04103]|uniref:hypothetical protein n=1 Tax=Massilia sp. YIM B04103 TaxID=2963106 RepID=UPI0021090DD1|nr:hypothetical protein [Massilia sp. YIM B04103]